MAKTHLEFIAEDGLTSELLGLQVCSLVQMLDNFETVSFIWQQDICCYSLFYFSGGGCLKTGSLCVAQTGLSLLCRPGWPAGLTLTEMHLLSLSAKCWHEEFGDRCVCSGFRPVPPFPASSCLNNDSTSMTKVKITVSRDEAQWWRAYLVSMREALVQSPARQKWEGLQISCSCVFLRQFH